MPMTRYLAQLATRRAARDERAHRADHGDRDQRQWPILGRGLSYVSGRVTPMTPSSPLSAALTLRPPVEVGDPSGGELGVIFHLVFCRRCDADLAQPFADPQARDAWACQHLIDTGHIVHLTITDITGDQGEEGDPAAADMHLAVVLSSDGAGGYKWTCPAAGCRRENDPYATPAAALGSWAAHSPTSDQ